MLKTEVYFKLMTLQTSGSLSLTLGHHKFLLLSTSSASSPTFFYIEYSVLHKICQIMEVNCIANSDFKKRLDIWSHILTFLCSNTNKTVLVLCMLISFEWNLKWITKVIKYYLIILQMWSVPILSNSKKNKIKIRWRTNT